MPKAMKKSAKNGQTASKIRSIEQRYRRIFEALSKSEQEKSVILDAMTELVLYLDTDMRIIWANKAMHDAFRLVPGRLTESTATGRCTAEPGPAASARGKTLESGEPREVVDFSSYGKNWVLRSYPVRNEKGALTGVVEIVTDTTERIRAEEAMRLSEQRYRELFENAGDIIFILDLKGRILSCNASVSRTYGYEKEQLLGAQHRDPSGPGLCARRPGPDPEKAGSLQVPNPIEFLPAQRRRSRMAGGEPRIVKENGRQVSIHGIARNITERKLMEEALKKRSGSWRSSPATWRTPTRP
jgi:PAS domain-containing protein